MTYIEENLKLLREQQQGAGSSRESGADDHTGGGKEGGAGDMVKFGDKYKTTNKELKEGSVTASLAMLSAIPEVDLGMEYVVCLIVWGDPLTRTSRSPQRPTAEHSGDGKGQTGGGRRAAFVALWSSCWWSAGTRSREPIQR